MVDLFRTNYPRGRERSIAQFHYFERDHEMKQYIVDAFTDKPFSGNPAAVCVMEKWPSEESMM